MGEEVTEPISSEDSVKISEESTQSEGKEYKKPMTTRERVKGILKKGFNKYIIDAFTGMAQGLFCTLIAGTIFEMIGKWIFETGTPAGIQVGSVIITIAKIAKVLMGAGIGVGIAHMLKGTKLVMFTAAVAGMIGAFGMNIVNGSLASGTAFDLGTMAGDLFTKSLPGNPIGAYIVVILALEIGNLVQGKTKADIIVVPITMMVAMALGIWVAWPFIKLVDLIGEGVALATHATPAVMGIIVAVVVGVLLTLPTSSAAIWVAVAMPVIKAGDPVLVDAIMIAGGAATVGCACNMVGFAVQSFRENKWGGLVAQGIGTSMLQIPNLMRHPQIIVPPIIASIICGPLSTCVFQLRCGASGGGMGTSGLVGVFDIIENSAGIIPDWKLGLGIALLMFILPALISLAVTEIMRKLGWIKPDYMKLEL